MVQSRRALGKEALALDSASAFPAFPRDVRHAGRASAARRRAGADRLVPPPPPRARRDKTAHERQRLYLAQKWAHSLRRKAAVLGEDVWIPIPLGWDFPDGEFRYAAYFRELFAWFRARGV